MYTTFSSRVQFPLQPMTEFHQNDHYSDGIMGVMASQFTALMVCSTICSGADQRKHQSSVSLAFVRGIHRWPVNSPHKGKWRGKCFHLMTSSWISPFQGFCRSLFSVLLSYQRVSTSVHVLRQQCPTGAVLTRPRSLHGISPGGRHQCKGR